MQNAAAYRAEVLSYLGASHVIEAAPRLSARAERFYAAADRVGGATWAAALDSLAPALGMGLAIAHAATRIEPEHQCATAHQILAAAALLELEAVNHRLDYLPRPRGRLLDRLQPGWTGGMAPAELEAKADFEDAIWHAIGSLREESNRLWLRRPILMSAADGDFPED